MGGYVRSVGEPARRGFLCYHLCCAFGRYIRKEQVHMQTETTPRACCRSFAKGACALALASTLAFLGVPVIPSDQALAVTSSELQAQADELFQRIDALQTDLNAANADYDEAVAAHDAAVEAMDDAQDRIDEAQQQLQKLQGRLSDRAVSMYKTGGSATMLDVVLGTSSFDEFLTAWDMMQRVIEQDQQLVQETKDLRAEAQAAYEEYSEQEQIAAEQIDRAEQLRSEIQATQDSLRAEADSITEEIAELQAQEELQAEAARQAKEAAERAAAEQAAANQGGGSGAGESVVAGSGQLAHPLPGSTITSGFGWRSFDNSFHNGVDLAASSGTPYYAAEGGTVIMATNDGGYNGGAGNWIVISHGNGMVTKYMHSSAVYVSVGQQVTKGQNIGAVGSTGNSTGPHLHFQLEINGSPVNPLGYI